MRTPLRLIALLLTPLALLACDDGSAPDQGDAYRPPPACEDGARRCVGENVELCVAGVYVDQGPCADGELCRRGACEAETCTPDCARRECGDDGCGATCGTCEAGETCSVAGACEPPAPACGDGICGAGETCGACPADCGCGEGFSCQGGQCVAVCVPDCDGRVCGTDGCGGRCGDCPAGDVCDEDGQCGPPPASCGDATCDAGESCLNCPADCGVCCGDGACTAAHGENCATCLADCRCPGGQRCDVETFQCVAACVPDCQGRVCGDNGCGGRCGDCPGAQVCDRDGRCNPPPAQCGDDTCDAGEDCQNCPADCGACCGDARCDAAVGESCATCPVDCRCPQGQQCALEQRICVEQCVPACGGRQCGPDGCGGECGRCGPGFQCDARGQCGEICEPVCDGRACGPDGCGGECGDCGQGAVCSPAGQCLDVGATCDCEGGEICLDGFCRQPGALCSADNPIGLCPLGQSCLDGVCRDRGAACSADNPIGACPLGELCRGGACAALDDAALCNDGNACTADRFDPIRNRCVHVPQVVPCEDGNACTADACSVDGVCESAPIAGCVEPPVIGPYTTPTNVGELRLTGSKPAGASIEVNGQVAVPESPEQQWAVTINLVPGENVFEIRSVDRGNRSQSRTIRVVYDVTPPLVEVSPCGGTYRDGVTVTAAANEAADVWFTTDGGTPTLFDRTFFGAQSFRVFEDTTLRFIARDRAGNQSAQETRCEFTVTGYGNEWRAVEALPEPLSLAAVTSDGADRVFVVGGTDGDAPQAGAAMYDAGDEAWTNLPALAIARSEAAAAWHGGRIYLFGGQNEGVPLNLTQRLNPGVDAAWQDRRPMPTTRFGLAVAVVGDQIYTFGGKTNGGVVLPTVERYAPLNDTWTNQIAQMPRPRYAFAAVPVDRDIYLVGGEDEDGVPIAEVDVYNIDGNNYRQAPPLPTPRSFLAAAELQNIGAVYGGHVGVVVAGGRVAGGASTPVVEEYLVDRDRWQTRTPLLAPRRGHGGALLVRDAPLDTVERQLWIVGGQIRDALTAELVAYRQELDYAALLTPLPEGRFLHAAVPWAGRIYLFGGRNFAETVEGWSYDPETGVYRRMPDLPSFQNGLAAAEVGGRIYALGGANNFGLALPTNRSIDPADGEWTAHRPMQVARRDAAVAVLRGEIWLIGGDNNGPQQSVEIYNPATDRWRNGPLLPQARAGARAFVREGAIYLVGGIGEGGAQQNRVLRLAAENQQWQVYGDPIAVAYGAVVPVHDNQVAIIGGRANGALTGNAIRWNWRTGRIDRPWNVDSQLGLPLDRAAVAAHNGRIYVFGGNAAVQPGPEGEAVVQSFDTQCFDGVVGFGEGQDVAFPDVGGMCGRATGCGFLQDIRTAAFQRCQADGFTCEYDGNIGVIGYRGGAGSGSNCNDANTWRTYCFANGLTQRGCVNCVTGRITGGHSPCACNNARLAGTWCD
ncbi:MAG: chitobiase/beta-hexosaminidase C-terminal domain-containing protein [Myxococcales bacterium]|nr:chitobiase/beta-hexosaminidase C-terminal domain-containing protein [Myxococcales bacterium]